MIKKEVLWFKRHRCEVNDFLVANLKNIFHFIQCIQNKPLIHDELRSTKKSSQGKYLQSLKLRRVFPNTQSIDGHSLSMFYFILYRINWILVTFANLIFLSDTNERTIKPSMDILPQFFSIKLFYKFICKYIFF